MTLNAEPKAHVERRLRTQSGDRPAAPQDPVVDLAQLLADLKTAFVAGNTELALIKAAIIGPEAPSDATQGIPVGFIRSVHVVTAGVPVQGPDRDIPQGYSMVVRQRRHAGTPTGYFGFTEGDVGAELTRSEMGDGDVFILSTTRVKNLKNLWFDADTADTFFELVVMT